MPLSSHYDLADRLFQIAPWDWMEERQIIRVIHPETGESAYLSVMGSGGEHVCLAVYLGEDALRRFHLMQSDDPFDPEFPQADHLHLILEARQLQCAFGIRAELRSDELAEIKQLGRKYRGDNWPMFRSFRPGHAPGPVDDAEAVWLSHAIEQLLEVAPTLQLDPLGDSRLDGDVVDILTREFRDGTWQSTWTELESSSHEWATPEPDRSLLKKVKSHERLLDLECSFQLVPSPVGPTPRSAVFPYLVVTADAQSGMILGMEILSVEKQSHAELIASAPNVFLRQWDKAGIRPASIRVATITSYSVLEIAAAELNTPMRRGNRLPAIDRMMREMPI
jgi:hypothetical protein